MPLLSKLFGTKYEEFEYIFTAKIDFTPSARKKADGQKLHPERTYYVGDKEINSSAVEKTIKNNLQEQLPNDLYEILRINAKVEIRKINYGSIEVIFAIIASSYYGISKYKNFIDSYELIKKQAGILINKALRNEYGDDVLEVNVQPEIIHRRDPISNIYSRRDAFFYYLLIMNIILFFIIGVLVFKAVVSFYHW